MAVNDRAQQGRFKSSLKDRDFKWLDLLGRKIYTSASLQMWIANQEALLSTFNFLNWTAVYKFMDQLSGVLHEIFWVFVMEGCLVAKASLQSALDVADTLASAITLLAAKFWNHV